VAEAVKARYKDLMAEDKFEFRTMPGKHAEVQITEILGLAAWLEKWLKAPLP
jgi:hypothetical protein